MKRILIGAAMVLGLWTVSASAQNIDHYKCWQYKGDQNLKNFPGHTATDQVGTHVIEGKKLAFLCNPALKDNVNLGDLINPNDHLCCYKVKPVTAAPPVTYSDQFGTFPISPKKWKLFCTPCEKS